LGIGDDDVVVAYDDSGGGTAGRLVWMLRAVGQPAALLSGGLAGWPGPLVTGPATPRPPVTRTVRPWPKAWFATIDDVRRGEATVLDARSSDRYRGDHEPIDRVAGHIPGARNVPWQKLLDDTGRVAPPAVLRERFVAAGVTPGRPVITSCGSGVSACLEALALQAAGWEDVRLFVASWSGWAADPANPVATGDR
jgi:thiosulfate/3-mercaptopyruvate sulfurtransferase